MMVESLEGGDLCIPSLNTTCRPMSVTHRAMLIKTLLSCFCLLTVMLNLLVIISISHFRQLQTPTNLILLSLAVSDLLVGLASMPLAINNLVSCQNIDKISCALSYLLAFILTSASVGSMVLIAVDRYVAICYPLRYSFIITTSRVKMCVCLCWMCSVIYNLIILKGNWSQIVLSNPCHEVCTIIIDYISGAVDLILTFFGPVIVIIVLYVRVFVVAVSQARVMRSQISAAKSNTVTVKKSELRAARTLGIVLLVFIICLCPYFFPSITGQDTTTDGNSLAQIFLFYCNSTFNPLIYAFFYPWFRKSVKLIVRLQILQPGSRESKIM
uniref:trace amine-associated receptor 13c-like n=1 Tax=Scatophagus argus TaxID=75038 RepID=UPI001ED8238C|nr:trace amine-associated receptor 13c-like [Scatophagus argus]